MTTTEIDDGLTPSDRLNLLRAVEQPELARHHDDGAGGVRPAGRTDPRRAGRRRG